MQKPQFEHSVQCLHLFNAINSTGNICEQSRFHSLLIFTTALVHNKCWQFQHRTERFSNCSLNYIPNWSGLKLPRTSQTYAPIIEMATKTKQTQTKQEKCSKKKDKALKNVEAMAFHSCAVDWLRDVDFCFVSFHLWYNIARQSLLQSHKLYLFLCSNWTKIE